MTQRGVVIPEELRRLPQWVVAGPNKEPVNPRDGTIADVTDPSTWATYEDAVQHGLPVGFVLTRNDPYAFVDLDHPFCKACNSESCEHATAIAERHRRIFEAFDTYAELSISGKGIHLICRGSVPHGTKRDKVEVYSDSRYMICTGNTLRNIEIRPQQELLDILFDEISAADYGFVDLEDYESVIDDGELVEMASNAVNGDKFDKLCNGLWQDEYPSQSEADFALLAIIAFYTRNNDQVKRIFRMTGLGKREKALREDYLNRCLKKIRSHDAPPVDFTDVTLPDPRLSDEGPDHGQPTTLSPDQGSSTRPPVPLVSSGERLSFPPGFVGQIADYIYRTSSRPVQEVGIAAALALAAGVCGRQFNISNTGLNLYLILLAKTGVGKEGATSGIERLIASVRDEVPLVDDFLGPGDFASGQAIYRTLDTKPCFVSVLGEFGLKLQSLSEAGPSSTWATTMRRALLDVYGKSGKGGVVFPSAYSDSEKNTKLLYSPAMTLLGESTPDTFFAGLSLQHIADGLVPRFLSIEYTGDRPKRNRGAFAKPERWMSDRLADLVSTNLTMRNNQSWADVGVDPGAEKLLDAWDEEVDQRINAPTTVDTLRELWNRAHLNALRLAGVLAAADRPHNPIVNEEEARWAIGVVRNHCITMAQRFESGDVGEGEQKQDSDLLRVLKDYVDRPWDEIKKYCPGIEEGQLMHSKRTVPHAYLQRRTAGLAAFRKHRSGSRGALRDAIADLLRADIVREIPKDQMLREFRSAQTAYFFRGV